VSSDVTNWGSTTINGSYITGAVRLNGVSTVTGSILLDGIYVTGNAAGDKNTGTFTVSGNNITNPAGAAVNAAGSGTIKSNIIWGSDRGITQEDNTVLSATIQGNLIKNNSFGVYLRDSRDDAIVKDNTFTANQVGIFNPGYQLTVNGNNFVDNTHYDVQAGASAVDAENNWWGTTDRLAIAEKIFDSNDDFSLGTIIFTPFLTLANTNAPSSPADLMLPAATAAPTEAVTFQTVNNPSASLGGFEIALAVALVIMGVLVAAVAVRMRGKRA
jgi:parallel beta-helix repeat protein